ncbi:hypothetical protein T492DRAFT_1030715 [Pavlovales sp. CCMP2436]|nr:hypothetical protein T492DRAFT_1030715 [Pavlovales sp. CCMP2436]
MSGPRGWAEGENAHSPSLAERGWAGPIGARFDGDQPPLGKAGAHGFNGRGGGAPPGIPYAVLHYASAAERYVSVLDAAVPPPSPPDHVGGAHGAATTAAAHRALAAAERAKQAYAVAVGALASSAAGSSWISPAEGACSGPPSRLGSAIGASSAAKFATAAAAASSSGYYSGPASPAPTATLGGGGGGLSTPFSAGRYDYAGPDARRCSGAGYATSPGSAGGGGLQTPGRHGKDSFSAVACR